MHRFSLIAVLVLGACGSTVNTAPPIRYDQGEQAGSLGSSVPNGAQTVPNSPGGNQNQTGSTNPNGNQGTQNNGGGYGSGGTHSNPGTGATTVPNNPPQTTAPAPTTPTNPPVGGGTCPAGLTCVDSFPFTDSNTTSGKARTLNNYSCASSTNESGPEVIYELTLSEPGLLVASLSGLGGGVDVDVHILQTLSSGDCIDRGHWDSAAKLDAGTYHVVVDTWVDSSGDEKSGSYSVRLQLNTESDFEYAGLDSEVFDAALHVFDKAWGWGDTTSLKYGIIDFSMPSTEDRFWVIDLRDGTLEYSLLASHGSGSQDPSDLRYANSFSNVSGSNASSLGLAIAAETYWGSNGYSLRLDGKDSGYNNNVRTRAVVVHGASYSTPSFASSNGYLGRSWGCPAIDPAVSDDVIDMLKEGSAVWSYYPDSSFLNNTDYLVGW